MTPAAVVVVLISLPILLTAWRRPLLARLASRNVRRRPSETLLVLLGSMLGTAIITGSYIVGDTLNSSISAGAYMLLGPVDELVITASPQAAAKADRLLAPLIGHGISGTVEITQAGVAVSSGPHHSHVEPHATILELNFASGRSLGPNAAATGLVGPTPRPGHVDIGSDLAHTLHAQAGSTVSVYAFGTERSMIVDRVLPKLGLAGFSFGTAGFAAPNIFAAPGTLSSMAASSAAGPSAAGPSAAGPASRNAPSAGATIMHVIAISNGGTVLQGAARSHRAMAAITAVLHLPKAGVAAGAPEPMRVLPVKATLLDAAHTAGKQFTQLFGGIGFFSVLAGVLLVMNIFVMLAEERRRELGMLRAVGLSRSALVGTFSIEGWIYALGSSALGAVAGLGVGWLVVRAATSLFASAAAGSLTLSYSARPMSLALGFTIGFTISMLTILATSISIGRVNVIAAIRDLPAPRRTRRAGTAVAGLVAVAGGSIATVVGITHLLPYPTLAGPAIAAGGIVAAAQRLIGRPRIVRPIVSTVAVATLAWATSAFVVFHKVFAGSGIPVFVLQGIELTAGGVALISANQALIGKAVASLTGGRRSVALRIGLAYPLAKTFRTVMTLSMYSLVMFMLTFVTVYSHIFAAQVDHFTAEISGGFNLSVASNPTSPLSASEVASLHGVTKVATLSSGLADWSAGFSPGGFKPWLATAYGSRFVSGGPPMLAKRMAKYPSDTATYQALLRHPNLAIVSDFFLNEGGTPGAKPPQPGEHILIRNPVTGTTERLTIAGVSHAGFGNSLALVSPATLDRLFGPTLTPRLLFVRTAQGSSASAVAATINARFLANGATATTFAQRVRTNVAQQEQFFRLMEGYLALGLLIGIVGLGVVMVRSVRERRREVGILRAIGFRSSAARRAFLSEAAFVATEGVLIGAALAMVTAWRLASSKVFGTGLPFSIPWTEVSLLVGGTLVASVLATVIPAQQASRIRPAVALRIDD